MKQKFILILIICQTISFCAFSQKISYSLYGNVTYLNPETYIRNRADSFVYRQPINDSTQIRLHTFLKTSTKYTYNTNPGFNLGLGIHYNLTDRLRLNTGIQFEYFSFNRKEEFLNFQDDVIWKDTVPYVRYFLFDQVDHYENSIDDVGPVKEGTDFRMINIGIPIGLTYDIIPNTIFINAGISLQTPVYTSAGYEFTELSIRNENGQSIGKYSIQKTNAQTIFEKNNLQFGISGSVGYYINKQLSVNLGVSKTLSSVFIEDDLPFGYAQPPFNPLRFNFGLTYSFRK